MATYTVEFKTVIKTDHTSEVTSSKQLVSEAELAGKVSELVTRPGLESLVVRVVKGQ